MIRARGRAPRVVVLILGLAALVSACSDGPGGPGTLDGTVNSSASVGGVVLEVTGQGITGFVGQGGTRAFGAAVSGAQGRHRVILVSSSGDLRFGVQVEDLGAESPSVQVISATTTLNQPALLTGISVKLERP